MSDKQSLFEAANLKDPDICCARKGAGTQRCPKPAASATEFVCRTHYKDIAEGRPVRMYKATTAYKNSELRSEFNKRRDAIKGTLKKENRSNEIPSPFVGLYAPKTISFALFAVLLYFAELFELRALGIPESAALGQFDIVVLALGNFVPILTSLVGAILLIWVLIFAFEWLFRIFVFVWETLKSLLSSYLVPATLPYTALARRQSFLQYQERRNAYDVGAGFAHNYGSATSQQLANNPELRRILDLLWLKQKYDNRARAAARWARMRRRKLWPETMAKLANIRQTPRWFKLYWERLTKSVALNGDENEKAKALIRLQKNRSAVVQLGTLASLIALVLWLTYDAAQQRRNFAFEKVECSFDAVSSDKPVTSNQFSSSPFVGRGQMGELRQASLLPQEWQFGQIAKSLLHIVALPIGAIVGQVIQLNAADCGYLVFEGSKDRTNSLISAASFQDRDGTEETKRYSEKVIYLGDYGDWAAVVPFGHTEKYRNLLKQENALKRRGEILEDSIDRLNEDRQMTKNDILKKIRETNKSLEKNRFDIRGQKLKPTLIKRSVIQEFSALEPNNGIAEDGAAAVSRTVHWINVDSRGNRISYHYPDGGMSDELEQLIAKIADGVDDNGQSIAEIKKEIGALRKTDDLLSRQQRSIWEIAQANFALATWLSRVADRDTVLDTWKIVSDSEFGVRNTNKMLRDYVREGGKSGPAFGPLALPVPVRAADIMTTLATLNDETLEQCVRDRDNSRFVEFGRNQISPPQATAQQKDAIAEVFEATNERVRDIMSGETRAYVFFAGAASNDGPVGWNEMLAEKRAYWAQAAWTDQFTEPGAGQNFETVAFGQGERLSKVGVSSARSVEIFVCPHQISDNEQPKDEVEQIAEK